MSKRDELERLIHLGDAWFIRVYNWAPDDMKIYDTLFLWGELKEELRSQFNDAVQTRAKEAA